MGIVRIQIAGSFGKSDTREFSAMEGGHAMALSRAIAFLSFEMPAKDDMNIGDVFDQLIKPVLLAAGFHEETVREAIEEETR